MSADGELRIFEAVRAQSADPVEPVRLDPDDSFAFRCHPEVGCWNACCSGADVTLTPYDILRLSRRLDVRPRAFLAEYTVPAVWEAAGLPVAKLKMGGEDGEGPCPFVADAGCTVYDDRPATCRYYPLGFGTFKPSGGGEGTDFHFLVKEGHCRGHFEDRSQSVRAFRREQGVGEYDLVNRGWIDILMKMASWRTLGGPRGRDLKPETKRMFFLVSTDVDGFRSFVLGTRFLDLYDVPPERVTLVEESDEALLQLGFDWLKNVIFNEPTLVMKEAVLKEAIARARSDLGAT